MRRTAKPWVAALSVAACFLLGACALVLPAHSNSDLKLDSIATSVNMTEMETPQGQMTAETTATAYVEAGLAAAEFESCLSEYEPFGVTYRFGTFFYGDSPIREFIDGHVSESSNGGRAVIARLALNHPSGEVDVHMERTYDEASATFGPITGMQVQAVPHLLETTWQGAADMATDAVEAQTTLSQTAET